MAVWGQLFYSVFSLLDNVLHLHCCCCGTSCCCYQSFLFCFGSLFLGINSFARVYKLVWVLCHSFARMNSNKCSAIFLFIFSMSLHEPSNTSIHSIFSPSFVNFLKSLHIHSPDTLLGTPVTLLVNTSSLSANRGRDAYPSAAACLCCPSESCA